MSRRSQSKKPSVAVVIPTLGRSDRIAASLPPLVAALEKRAHSGDEILVVDDSGRESAAGAVSEVLGGLGTEERERPVRVVPTNENVGFASAVLRGAEETKANLLFVVQDDVVVEEEALDALAQAIARSEDVFAVAPRIRVVAEDGADVTTFESMVSVTLVDDRILVREKSAAEIAAAEEATAPREIDFAPSSAFLVRRDEFLEFGGFDELFAPFDWEDVDLSLNARRRGRRILEVPAARAVHRRMGGSLDDAIDADLARAVRERNRLLLRWKHLSTREDAADHLVSLWRNVIEAALTGDRRTLEDVVLAFDKLGDVSASRAQVSSAGALRLQA
ncbi:MAG: glycosyltransferase [Planctomycetota bacterium]